MLKATDTALTALPLVGLIQRGGAIIRSNKVAPPDARDDDSHLVQSIVLWWYAIPSVIRYFVSGNIGNLFLFFFERMISAAMAIESVNAMMPAKIQEPGALRDSVSFFSAYLAHVPPQHFLHALLVYGLSSINTSEKYFKTLGGMYSALITASIGSTALNGFLLARGMDKTLAFLTTMYSFAFFNYFVIGWIVRKSNASSSKKAAETKQSSNRATKTRGGGAALFPSLEQSKSSLPSSLQRRTADTVSANLNPLLCSQTVALERLP